MELTPYHYNFHTRYVYYELPEMCSVWKASFSSLRWTTWGEAPPGGRVV